ncbi:MAG TPA: hypothetical protein VGO07_01660, partial [Candidatus Saccharimonadales bacterium]|nr:hypothetical protein [Candidatus Saccharimonadales bacterium]
ERYPWYGDDEQPVTQEVDLDEGMVILHDKAAAERRLKGLLKEWVHDLTNLSFMFTSTFTTREKFAGGIFNLIRAGYMERVVHDGYVRRQGMDQPVFWLDADTPFMRRGALAKMRDAVLADEAHVVRARLQLIGDNPSAPRFSERSDSEKAAALYALTRSMIERNLSPLADRGYVDESGICMKLGTYCLAGGVGVSDPRLGESRTFLARVSQACEVGLLDGTVPPLKYVDAAVIGNSYRRYQALAKIYPPHALPLTREGPDYLDYQTIQGLGGAGPDISYGPFTRSQATKMIEVMVAQQEQRGTDHPLTPTQYRRLGATMIRFGLPE